ncbi:MAG TPA: PIN domain-containing protein [Ktedonobacterales bacterium]|nr:PIN domain-containing protein [Ktedonobacterales bacterium]
MGALSLPSSGTVYMDANSIIYSIERVEPYRTLLEPLWLASGPTTFWLASSELTLLEALVGPLKTGDAIHAATALEHGCTLFVTNDATFRRVPGLPVTILADLLTP